MCQSQPHRLTGSLHLTSGAIVDTRHSTLDTRPSTTQQPAVTALGSRALQSNPMWPRCPVRLHFCRRAMAACNLLV